MAAVTLTARAPAGQFIVPRAATVSSSCTPSPCIASVTGTVTNASAITVTGLGFGSTGQTPAVFDDMEGGTNGNAMTTNLAPVGAWSSIGTGQVPHYSTTEHVSGTKSMKVDTATDPSGGANGGTGAAVDFSSRDVFAVFWVKVPTGNAAIGNGNGPNWKITWLYVDTATDDLTPATTAFPDPDLCPGHYACNWALFGNNQPMSDDNAGFFPGPCGSSGYSPCTGTGDWIVDTNIWYRVVQYYHADTVNHGVGVNDVWVSSTDASKAFTHHYHSDHANQASSANWVEFVFNGFSRQTTSGTALIYMDDLYVATSATSGAAQARVEITNNATYNSSTNFALCPPTAWSATSISCTLRKGSLSNGTNYAWVTDASGNHIGPQAVTVS